MAGDSFILRVEGQDDVERMLARLAARTADLSPLMDIIGTVMESDNADNFEGEHAPDGTPWTPSERAKETGGKTLQDSRLLFLSMTHRSGPTFAEAGTNKVYARRHNQGWSGTEQVASHKRVLEEVFGVKLAEPITVTVKAHSRKANTPRRQFVGLSAGAREEIVAIAGDWLAGDAA